VSLDIRTYTAESATRLHTITMRRDTADPGAFWISGDLAGRFEASGCPQARLLLVQMAKRSGMTRLRAARRAVCPQYTAT
jgi:hypothetical protein